MKSSNKPLASMKISDAKQLPHGGTVDQIVGVLSDVGEHRTMQGNDGFYTLQSAKLSDGPDWLFVEFANLSDVSVCQGHEVELRSTTSRHGTQGVIVKAVQRGDRTYKNLRVTASAKFLVGELLNKPVESRRGQLRKERNK